jgi:ABC-2 type transport system ATP-binding protein
LQAPSADPLVDLQLREAEASSGAAAAAIHTQQLSKRYGRTLALSGLTMTVPRGEVFGFLGPNGAGKTTAVKLLLGLAGPTSGQAWLLGAPAGHREARRQVGYLPELFRYQGWLSAREVLGFHCQLAGVPGDQLPGEVDGALRVAGLLNRGDDRVATFSKGMQQRLGLGVALLGRPELVILDEPTSALDPVGRHDVREIIRGLRARGATVFLNSHLLGEVEQVCDRVAVLDRGRVIATGSIEDLLSVGATVRMRITGLSLAERAALGRYGSVTDEGGWLTFHALSTEAVPDVVAEAVRLGGRVYAIESHHQTLEDRFLQLLGDDA